MHKANLLIVDDEEFVRESLSALFVEQEGYSVFTAITGQDALDTAKYTKLNVALIDILLPDKDGITLLKELKKLDPDMVCIIITSHADLDNAIEALKGGADSYFKKPLYDDEIIHRTAGLLEKQQLKIRLRESEERYRGLVEASNDAYYLFQYNRRDNPVESGCHEDLRLFTG